MLNIHKTQLTLFKDVNERCSSLKWFEDSYEKGLSLTRLIEATDKTKRRYLDWKAYRESTTVYGLTMTDDNSICMSRSLFARRSEILEGFRTALDIDHSDTSRKSGWALAWIVVCFDKKASLCLWGQSA